MNPGCAYNPSLPLIPISADKFWLFKNLMGILHLPCNKPVQVCKLAIPIAFSNNHLWLCSQVFRSAGMTLFCSARNGRVPRGKQKYKGSLYMYTQYWQSCHTYLLLAKVRLGATPQVSGGGKDRLRKCSRNHNVTQQANLNTGPIVSVISVWIHLPLLQNIIPIF